MIWSLKLGKIERKDTTILFPDSWEENYVRCLWTPRQVQKSDTFCLEAVQLNDGDWILL